MRKIFIGIFLLLMAISAAVIAIIITRSLANDQIQTYCSSLQIVIFIFSASGGSLILLKYLESLDSKVEQQKWEKLKYLENTFDNFKKNNSTMLKVFDWKHILIKEYWPLCSRCLEYDEIDDLEQKEKLFNQEEYDKIWDLGDFLEYFENLYFAIENRLIKEEDLLIYYKYYILLLGDLYYDETDNRLKLFIDAYFYNIPPLLEQFNKKLLKEKNIKRKEYKYYPREKK